MGKNVYNRKKGYRYEQKKKKKINRDILSYEDMPLEDYDKENAEISKPAIKKILIVVACIVVLGLVVFAVSNRENLTPEKISRWFTYELLGKSDQGFPVAIQSANVNEGNFVCEGSEISYVSDTTFQSLSTTGNEIGYSQISFKNPVLVVSGEYVLIYDLGGKEYVTGKKTQLNEPRQTEYEIFTADINSKGDYAFVTKADGYLSKLYAYNKYNDKRYAYSFADYYITSVDMNNNGSGCVSCGFTGSKGSLKSVAYVLNFSKEKPAYIYNFEENVIFDVEFINSNIACVVGSEASFMISSNTENLVKIDYKQKELTSFDIDKETGKLLLSLSRSGDGNQCTLEYIDFNGEILNTNKTKLSAKSVSLYKNRVAVLDDDTCYLYDTLGESIGKKSTGNGAKAIRLNSTDSVYVLGIKEIRELIEITK